MIKQAIAISGGLILWIVSATVFATLLKASWPAYAAITDARDYTLAMQITRLAIGAAATLIAGTVVGLIAGARAVLIAGIVLLLLALFIHAQVWQSYPIWYHLTFFAYLVPLTLWGGRWGRTA